jgi:hypothetical protein
MQRTTPPLTPLLPLALLLLLLLGVAQTVAHSQALSPAAYLPIVARPWPPTATPTMLPTETPVPPTATATTLIPPTIPSFPTSPPGQTPTGTPPPMTAVNFVCSPAGTATQLCAWVTNGTPAQLTDVTVYGRYWVNGAGVAHQTMQTAWHYRSTSNSCGATTDENGVAHCFRNIGGATVGYRVNIDVTVNGVTVQTWFIPR